MSEKAEELARAVAKSVSDAIHTPVVLDIYGSAADLIDAELAKERSECARSYRSRLELALAQLPEERKRDPHEAGYAEAIEDMIDMLGPAS